MARLALALGLGQSGFHAFVAALPLAMLAVGRQDGEIGAIMGSAAVFNIVAALISGGLIDRFGGRVVFLWGAACFVAAGALLASGLVTAGGSVAGLLVVRLLQGVALGAVMPSVLSLVPSMVAPRRLPTALAFVGVAANLSLAVVPPLSLVVLYAAGLPTLAALTIVTVAVGAVMIWPVRPRPELSGESADEPKAPHSFRPKWRAAWAAPLSITVLFLLHWGVVTGYLPQRAERAGADVALFFSGDALALLVMRVPGGYLAGRFGSLPLAVAGLAVVTGGLVLLLLPPTTPLLIAAGVASGAGSGLLIPVLLLELSNRSDRTDRGSAFALFTVSFSIGIALGSLAFAPFIEAIGFEVALAAGIAALVGAAIVAVFDRPMRARPSADRGRVAEPAV
jgi:MFS family permease